jgi:hypothetical protein
MRVPEKFMGIMAEFQRALKTGETSDIDAIPLNDLIFAKAFLVKDRNSPYYSLLLDKIKEREAQDLAIVKEPPIVFISYDMRDINIVFTLDNILKRIFGERIKTFIARRDIKAGEDSFKKMLHDNLATCSLVLAICTKRSVTSSWLWFEAGAGFGSSNLIPLWVGITPQEFKEPMKIFQGKNLADQAEMKELMSRIAEITRIDDIDCGLTDDEIKNLKNIVSSLKSLKESNSQIKKIEDRVDFPLPYPRNFEQERKEEMPINYIIEARFHLKNPIPGQQLIKLLEDCRIKFRPYSTTWNYFPDLNKKGLSTDKGIWILHSSENHPYANEARQTGLFASDNLAITHWARHFNWRHEGPSLIYSSEINVLSTRFLIFCKKIGDKLGQGDMTLRIRLFDLQNGLLHLDSFLQGYKSYQAPSINEIEVEQSLSLGEGLKKEFSTFLMHVWDKFQAQDGGFPTLVEKDFLEFFDETINDNKE